MKSLLIILSIFIAIAIGNKAKINIGVICISFAYLFGVFMLGLKGSAVIALWPTSLFFFIMMATFFYGIAVTNGTLGLISEHALYAFRNWPWFLPILMWLICFILSGLGPGPTTIFAFMPVIVLGMADRIKMSKLTAAVIIVGGGVAGGYTPISLCYATVRTCLVNAGYAEAEIATMLPKIAFNNILAQVIIFVLIYVLTKSWKVDAPVYESKPEPLSSKQIKTLIVIGVGLAYMVLVPLFNTLIPGTKVLTVLKSGTEAGLLFALLAVVCLLLKLGNQKEALNFIPWGTIILVCGTGMLVAVAKSAGAVDYLSNWIGNNLSPFATKLIVSICAGCMSIFSSTLSVVGPTLIPIIPGVAAATGVSSTALISAIMVGGHFAGLSPLSVGGGMTMSGERDEEKKNKLFIQLIYLAAGAIVLASLLTITGILS